MRTYPHNLFRKALSEACRMHRERPQAFCRAKAKVHKRLSERFCSLYLCNTESDDKSILHLFTLFILNIPICSNLFNCTHFYPFSQYLTANNGSLSIERFTQGQNTGNFLAPPVEYIPGSMTVKTAINRDKYGLFKVLKEFLNFFKKSVDIWCSP